jgi:hypothetical protein
MKNLEFLIAFLIVLLTCSCFTDSKRGAEKSRKNLFVEVSKKFPRYFVTTDQKTWIPVMINFIIPNGEEEEVFKKVEAYFSHFSAFGGNAMRIWISSPFLEIEDTKQGEYNPVKFSRIDRLLKLAGKYNIRIKFTLQHVRSIVPEGEGVPSWSNCPVLSVQNGGTFENIRQYINSPEGRKNYLSRAKALADKYRDSPQIFSWELWNEMDAVDAGDWYPFSQEMLDAVQVLFPNHLVAQTLGSLHSADADARYEKLFTLGHNDYLTVHRYLDPGTDWNQYDHVHGPIDLLISQAIQFMYRPFVVVPVVANEHGAVEGNHTGPNKLYQVDTTGVFIHDMIFAPFFCGASGCGSMWHWDAYVEKQNLWFHYGRFISAMNGIDPVRERFVPFMAENDAVRFYGLKGLNKTLIWCRDSKSNWITELKNGIKPELRNNVIIEIPGVRLNEKTSIKFYDPWKDTWTVSNISKGQIILPPFLRSVIVVVE